MKFKAYVVRTYELEFDVDDEAGATEKERKRVAKQAEKDAAAQEFAGKLVSSRVDYVEESK